MDQLNMWCGKTGGGKWELICASGEWF